MFAVVSRLLRFVFIGIIYYFLYNFIKIMAIELSMDQSPREVGFYLMEEDGTIHPLYKSTTIGRARDSDIVIKDPYLSSKHALITKRRRHLMIQDLNSTNGSFVNGKRVKRPMVLRERDEITLGRRNFTLMRRETVGLHTREGLR